MAENTSDAFQAARVLNLYRLGQKVTEMGGLMEAHVAMGVPEDPPVRNVALGYLFYQAFSTMSLVQTIDTSRDLIETWLENRMDNKDPPTSEFMDTLNAKRQSPKGILGYRHGFISLV